MMSDYDPVGDEPVDVHPDEDEVDDAFGHLEGYPDGRDLDRLG